MKIDINALLHGSAPALSGKKLPAAGAFQQILAGLSDELPALNDLMPAMTRQGKEALPALAVEEEILPDDAAEADADAPDWDDLSPLPLSAAQMQEGAEPCPLWQLQHMVTRSAALPDKDAVAEESGTVRGTEESQRSPLKSDRVQLPMPAVTLNAVSTPQASALPPVVEHVPAATLMPASGDSAQPAIAPAELSVPRLAVPTAIAAPAGTPVPPAYSNPHPVGSAAWQHSLGQQLTIFTRDGVQNAEIRLHPEEMGALQISVRMQQDRAQLHIVSEHPLVRQALEAAIPQLRSALAESGVQLGQTQVSAETAHFTGAGTRDPSQGASGQPEPEDTGHSAEEESERSAISPVVIQGTGINTFA